MPLDLFLTIVGQTRDVPGLEELTGRGFTLEQIPENVRHDLFYRRTFIRRIGVLIEVLQKLKLIRRKKENEEDMLHLEETTGILLYLDLILFVLIALRRDH